MKNKKILFILHIPPPVHGSSTIGLYIKESKIINDAFDCKFVNLSTSERVDEIGKNPFGKIIRYLTIIKNVLRCLLIFKPDLCYFAITAKGIGFYKDAFIATIIKIFRVKIVYHFHNKGVSLYQHKTFDNILYKFIFNKSFIILLSKHLYCDIKKYVMEENVYYCPNGIPELNIEKAKTVDDRVRILFLSNLIESKGLYILLDACKILNCQNIDFECNFIGSETQNISSEKFNEEIMKRKLSRCVIYHGAKYGNEKLSYLVLSDIFVSPTYEDCFPLALIEAMQCQLPIVSTYEGGIPDIVIDSETGFLCQQKNIDDLAEKILILIKNKTLREEMGRKGYEHYRSHFTLGIFEENLMNILTHIN